MAEEKKPKIDLKARLKGAGGATPPPAAVGGGGIPVPAPVPAATSAPTPGVPVPKSDPGRGGGLPVPPGIPVGPPPAFGGASNRPALDPSNPLAAAVTPYRAPTPAAPAAPPQPQRIEVDEMAVQEARKGARKQGLIMGLVAAGVFAAVGYIAGGAMETNKGRQRSVADAKGLAADVQKSRDQMKTLADKVEAGRNSLLKDKKFPEGLAKDLNSINIDFDGTKLGGVRFSGFSTETTSALIEFITAVQTINDRRTATANLLTRLQKPIVEMFNAGQKQNINYVVFLGKKDPSGNPFGLLAALAKPIEVANPSSIQLPTELTATDPLPPRGNISAPKYTGGALDKPSAMYVLPKSIEAACPPSETTGQIAQLGSQLNKFIVDIRGEAAAAGGDVIVDTKVGLLEKADKLVAALNKVQ